MIDETKQELAAEYVLGSLEAHAAGAFEAELETDAELRTFVDELREATAALAHAAPRSPLPPELRVRVLAEVHSEAEVEPASVIRSRPPETSRFGFLPWALAAGFALTAGALWMERDQLSREAALLRSEALMLRNRDTVSLTRIATLTAQNDAYVKALGIVLWDAEKQRGVLNLTNFPKPAPGKDYQLWVIDSKNPQPISAGIIPVGSDGLARVSFTPEHTVRAADKFAISVEREGGAPSPGGPIIFVGN